MSQRSAIVAPRLKSGSNQGDLQNYRPIRNPTFMSNVAGRLVCHQLVVNLEQNGLLPELQFAYRRSRSTEAAVVKVVADFLSAADRVDQAACYGVPQGSVLGPVPCLSLPLVHR